MNTEDSTIYKVDQGNQAQRDIFRAGVGSVLYSMSVLKPLPPPLTDNGIGTSFLARLELDKKNTVLDRCRSAIILK
jgi:hypothetical protein